MVLGNDLDSVLSGCILHHAFGWPVAGFYDLSTFWLDSRLAPGTWLSGSWVAVDLDIHHSRVPSIGHHILSMYPDETIPGHDLSLNPNLVRGISVRAFQRKYPLSTAHFLLHVLEIEPESDDARQIVWLADSSYINGQSHRFRANVVEWVTTCLNAEWMLEDVARIDTDAFEARMQSRILPRLLATGLAPGRGQVQSRHRRLGGFQFQWTDPGMIRNGLQALFDEVSLMTGWRAPRIPLAYVGEAGIRRPAQLDSVLQSGEVAPFLAREGVFSYVIPNRGRINYTTGFVDE